MAGLKVDQMRLWEVQQIILMAEVQPIILMAEVQPELWTVKKTKMAYDDFCGIFFATWNTMVDFGESKAWVDELKQASNANILVPLVSCDTKCDPEVK